MFTEILGLLIVIGVICILFLKGKMSDNSNKTDQEVKVATEQLQAELEKAGSAILLKIDRKIDRLERATEKADQTINELKRYNAFLAEYVNKGLAQEMPLPTLHQQKDAKPASKAGFASVLQNVEQRIEEKKAPEEKPPQPVKPVERPAAPKAAPSVKAKPQIRVSRDDVDVQLSSTAKKIFLFLDEGMEVSEICRKLSLSKGAVEMIAKMYQKK